jgi:hypothetical protein
VKVIGVGFGRTGTASLKQALERLGFSPCYHMFDVVDDPSRMRHWLAAAQGQPVDWDEIFAGFETTVDWPAAAFWRDIVAHYPDAKVILTVRDPQRWYDSAVETIFANAGPMQNRAQRVVFPLLAKLSPDLGTFVKMTDAAVIRRVFEGRIADRAYAIEVFNRHIREVTEGIPADRLLVYEVSSGWAPLCDFLDVTEPRGVDFPRGNDARSFRREDRERMLRLLTRRFRRPSPNHS